MTSEDIINAARACLRTPFAHQGRLPGIALDCAGLIVHVAQAIGADYRDQQGYSLTPSGALEQALDEQPCLTYLDDTTDRQPGDVLLIRIGRDPSHLAIYTGPTMIHAYEPVGFVCEHDMTPQWARRITAVYRFAGVE